MAFFNDITLGYYYPADSVVHKLDPRTKLLTVLAIMSSLLLSENMIVFCFYAAFIILAIKISKLPISLVLRNLRPFLWLFLLTIFVHIFFSDGHIILRIPIIGLSVSREGIFLGILYSFRLTLLIVFAALLTLTTSPIELTDGLEKLCKPLNKLRIPVHEIVMMMTLALRFIPTLMEEAERLKKAQMSRGATFEGNIIKRVKNLIPLILPLFISAFRRADQLAFAMDSRCYTGGEGRTSFKRLELHHIYYGVLSISALFIVMAIII